MATALEALRDRMAEDTIDMSYDNMDGTFTLRLVLDSIGDAEDGVIVTEVSEVPVEEQDSSYSYFHIMSVLANEVTEEKLAETLVKLNEINMETLLGSYSVVADAGALVHKYVLRTPKAAAEQTAEELYNTLVDVVAIVNGDYDRVVAAIAEEITGCALPWAEHSLTGLCARTGGKGYDYRQRKKAVDPGPESDLGPVERGF